MDTDNNDFEFIANVKCNFDQDIDSSDNERLNDEYDLRKQVHKISELKKYLTQQTAEYYTLIKTLQKERGEYKKLNINLQSKLTQISQLKVTLENDHNKFNKILKSFNSITQTKKESVEKKEDIFPNNFNFIEQKSVITKHYSNNKTFPNMLKQLPQWVQGCYSDHPATQFECTQKIRKLLCIVHKPPIKAVVDSGVVTRLVQFLQREKFNCLQFEAAWALTNIASGTAENTAVIIRYGAVPIFVKLLKSNIMKLREQAICALANISGNSVECRNFVLNNNVLSSLLPLYNTNIETKEQITLLRNATWILNNFCRGKPLPDWKYIQLILKALNIMIQLDDDEILQDTCWAFSYLCDTNDNNNMRAIINSGSLNRLITLLNHSLPQVRHPALRTIGNIVTGCDEQTQYVINLGILKKLYDLITCDNTPIKREACWTISNITAGNKEQIEAVISANLIGPLINILKTEKFEVSKEALWAICNVTNGGSDVQIKYLVNEGVILPLCRFFNPYIIKSNKCLLVALEGIDNILNVGLRIANGDINKNDYARYVEEADGVYYLEQIQTNQLIPDEIYDKAAQIIKTYWK